MASVLRIPKAQLALILFIIFLSTLSHYPVLPSARLLLISLISSITFDLFFVSLRKQPLFMPYAAVVTGLIIALLAGPAAAWYQVALSSALAMAAKNFLRISGRHIFNPAAIGLFIVGILFRAPVAWWGTSFQSLTILLLPVIVSGFRLRRHYTMLSFIGAYTILPFALTTTITLSSLMISLLNPTVVFFTTVMLPEPMTSPSNPRRQVLFGLSAALFIQVLTYSPLHVTLPDLFIPALLLSNLLFFKLK